MWRERAKTKAAALLAAKRWRRQPPKTLITTPVEIRTLSSFTASSRNFPGTPAFSSRRLSLKPFSSINLDSHREREGIAETEEEEEESGDWEEEEEADEPEIGDGGDGGGIVLRDVPWGERVLSVAREVVLQLGDDIDLHAFKVSPKGYIYLRLDKLTHKYGCPSMDEIESFSRAYKRRLDEIGELGEIPDDLGLQVSSPGAERLLRTPDDLDRFKDMPMLVSYVEDKTDTNNQNHTEKVLVLDSVDTESQQCTWKLANVRENRDAQNKGRPLSRKQKDWRLTLSFESIKRVNLYLDSKAK
ncbi:uncharacterized protein A4U43_C07F34100 [Asparagus officinalis]|uniref:DUF7912 domain-containing protein n=1 Tax=Asparagus officinalis TaxID=4686 RepID=A0A5P1EM66_ASPOF|nr:uncharacterized protein LOC109848493 [Asparagus officinalis]ONK65140.1 uncharacterized protein A4U43_C07F34100 [Asparagus officinalis]